MKCDVETSRTFLLKLLKMKRVRSDVLIYRQAYANNYVYQWKLSQRWQVVDVP